jgi:hypothetical protein
MTQGFANSPTAVEARVKMQSGVPWLRIDEWLVDEGWNRVEIDRFLDSVEAEWASREPGFLKLVFGFEGRIGIGTFWVRRGIELVVLYGSLGISV